MTDADRRYAKSIGRNISAARGRLQLSQVAVAARMADLGFDWHQQTLGAVEKGKRRVTAEEILGLGFALDTTAVELMVPWGDEEIELPGGEVFDARVVRIVISGGDFSHEPVDRADRIRAFRRGIRWDGNNLIRVPSRYDEKPVLGRVQ
jgi:transcriptional regulator with XRE-family HTH domain